MLHDYAAILSDLQRLRESAVPLNIFGSNSHEFKLNPTLSEEAVLQFERRHRVVLPEQYRGFLIHVGNGGAGPYYGLFKLGEMDDGFDNKPWNENDGFVGSLSSSFTHTGPWNDLSEEPIFDESRSTDLEYEDEYGEKLTEWENRVYWNSANMNGAVPICHVGCALRLWLVLTGPEAGNVWDDLRADKQGIQPVKQAGQDRVSFLQWYCDWLDDALKQLKSH
jgi:hypothetical protein